MKTVKIALACVFVYLLINCVNLINQEMRLQNYQARLNHDMQKVQQEHNDLKRDIKHYSTSEGVEELARQRLGYYKKGEIPLRVIETPSQTQKPSAGEGTTPTIELTGPTQPL